MTDKIAQITEKMIAYDKGDIPRIEHFMKVYGYAAAIGKLEKTGSRHSGDTGNRCSSPRYRESKSVKKNTTAAPENIRK